MNVLNRRTVIITVDTTTPDYINNTIFTRISNVAFIPNEVIVRSISVRNRANNNENIIISSSLLGNNVLGSCSVHSAETSNTNPQSVFPLNIPVNGNYSFTLNTPNNQLIINIVLEFIQYAN